MIKGAWALASIALLAAILGVVSYAVFTGDDDSERYQMDFHEGRLDFIEGRLAELRADIDEINAGMEWLPLLFMGMAGDFEDSGGPIAPFTLFPSSEDVGISNCEAVPVTVREDCREAFR